jgi:hypothetical protein
MCSLSEPTCLYRVKPERGANMMIQFPNRYLQLTLSGLRQHNVHSVNFNSDFVKCGKVSFCSFNIDIPYPEDREKRSVVFRFVQDSIKEHSKYYPHSEHDLQRAKRMIDAAFGECEDCVPGNMFLLSLTIDNERGILYELISILEAVNELYQSEVLTITDIQTPVRVDFYENLRQVDLTIIVAKEFPLSRKELEGLVRDISYRGQVESKSMKVGSTIN